MSTELCIEFSRSVAHAIFNIRVILGSITTLLCLLAAVAVTCITLYFKESTFSRRLVLYFMIASTVQALCQVLGVVPVEVTDGGILSIRNGSGWSDMCAIVGYLDTVSSSVANLVIIWFMLYMLQQRYRQIQRKSKGHIFSTNKSRYVYEIVGVLLVIAIPILIGWIPFVKDMYGLSGPWCWIKTVSEKGCHDSDVRKWSLGLMVAMFYVPLLCTLVLCAVVVFSRSAKGSFFYPFVYCFFSVFLLVNRIYSYTHLNSNDRTAYYPLWIVHSVAEQCRSLIPSLAVLLLVGLALVCSSCLPSSGIETDDQNMMMTGSPVGIDPEESEVARIGDNNNGAIAAHHLLVNDAPDQPPDHNELELQLSPAAEVAGHAQNSVDEKDEELEKKLALPDYISSRPKKDKN